ncbi:MAG TPA: hypothetical protein VFS29_09020 [Motilibacteraceae bacterium]|nr:hypothetical protein [Motilibacteraceae bacterium]
MTGAPRPPGRRHGALVALAAGMLTAPLAQAALERAVQRGRLGGAERWSRTNHRGESVSLLEGPAAVLAAAVATAAAGPTGRRPAVLATLAAGALGALDDLRGDGGDRGLRGHLSAAAQGRVTTGAVKVVGIGAAGLLAGRLLVEPEPTQDGTAAGPVGGLLVDVVLVGGVVAGTANLLNLLDLRPGRALKAALLLAAPVVLPDRPGAAAAAATAGVALGLLPADLAERSMLGDAGANALGALLGVAAASGASRRSLAGRLAVLVGLTVASERVSFTRVIEAVAPLRAVDRLGRRPLPAASARADGRPAGEGADEGADEGAGEGAGEAIRGTGGSEEGPGPAGSR